MNRKGAFYDYETASHEPQLGNPGIGEGAHIPHLFYIFYLSLKYDIAKKIIKISYMGVMDTGHKS